MEICSCYIYTPIKKNIIDGSHFQSIPKAETEATMPLASPFRLSKYFGMRTTPKKAQRGLEIPVNRELDLDDTSEAELPREKMKPIWIGLKNYKF